MPHISLPQDLPGIRSLVAYRTDTGQLLYELAERLLRSESTLSPADRELIAAYVSSRNECLFCTSSHAAASRHLYGERASVVDAVIADLETAPVDEKLRALLRIAGKVQQNGRLVTEDDIQAARAQGATDREIHDTVLIAAAFSMYNRYVDGLATWAPSDPEAYAEMGKRMAEQGYAARFAQVVGAAKA
ncbi:MAG TPA: peroxidase-related enzyme [Longimicrobiaceae bacterium]